MKTSNTNEYPIVPFQTPGKFEKWLAENHETSRGIWIRLFRKSSGKESVTHQEALQEALCYGWIDGQANKYDDESWLQKFTPRRPGSTWSKKNTRTAEQLMALGKMKPSGLAQIEKAKADGRWAKAYDSPSEMTIPDDFMKELFKNKKAKAFFETLNRTNRFSIAWRLQTAKKPETRERRMKKIIEMLSNGEKFH